MMAELAWFPPDINVPSGLKTPDFQLRALTVDDCDLDYAAVIATRPLLLLRSQGNWPRPGFTWQENYADLKRHQDEHDTRAAFTYTMMNHDGSLCLGCVYILPLRDSLYFGGLDEAMINTQPELSAKVSFWVRPEGHENGLDKKLLAALINWFKAVWPFSVILFEASDMNGTMLRLLEEAGLERRFTLNYQERPQPYHLYGTSSE